VSLEATRALTNLAAEKLDDAWAKELALTEEERGLVATSISAAKVLATRTGLDITSRMFEVAGSRATHAGLRLDRHWRNLRTHTLHDPIDYKIKELGEWALNGSFPNPTFYS
jgi:alkylation response protein AidB-like acyl-CoA dehydrogenase